MNNLKLFSLLFITFLVLTGCKKDKEPESCFSSMVDGSEVSFDAGCSENAESYDWEFGDGETSISSNPTHQYQSTGTFEVSLRVTGPDGGTSTSTKAVTIDEHCATCTCTLQGQSESETFCGTAEEVEEFCNTCESFSYCNCY